MSAEADKTGDDRDRCGAEQNSDPSSAAFGHGPIRTPVILVE
jgi:hypothetical protein